MRGSASVDSDYVMLVCVCIVVVRLLGLLTVNIAGCVLRV